MSELTNHVPASHAADGDSRREFLRHTLATIAYRGGKAVRDAPAGFADFRGAEGLRTPAQILAHIGDLFDWALSISMGQQKYGQSEPLPWPQETERFFASLKKLDDFMASSASLEAPPEKLLQGPIADALTHIGQIAILRRMAGAPMKGENYYAAEIKPGHVGPNQPQPKYEF